MRFETILEAPQLVSRAAPGVVGEGPECRARRADPEEILHPWSIIQILVYDVTQAANAAAGPPHPGTPAPCVRVSCITRACFEWTEPGMADTYDVFVSYARADGEQVRRLVENLHQSGLQLFFDEWEV